METITILTAEAARTITNDILHNEMKEMVFLVAKRIKEAAYEGHNSISKCYHKEWSLEQRDNLIAFFRNLGYKVNSNNYGYINITWQ